MPYADPLKKKQSDAAYGKANRERLYANQRTWRKENAERYRWYTIKHRYGITKQDYEAMLEKQGGACAICRTADEPGPWGFLVVDHDHETGRVRGLLCSPCNTLLGGARDRSDVLRSAIAYLERGDV